MNKLIFNPKTKEDLFSLKVIENTTAKIIDTIKDYNPVIYLVEQVNLFDELWGKLKNDNANGFINYKICDYIVDLYIDNNYGNYYFTLLNEHYHKTRGTVINYICSHVNHNVFNSNQNKPFLNTKLKYCIEEGEFVRYIAKLLPIYKKDVISLFFTASLLIIRKTLNKQQLNFVK